MSQFSNILISPAPFKGLLTAGEASEAIKEGILLAQPESNVNTLPMADGGMGTVQAVAGALSGGIRELDVIGPMGDIVRARYTIIDGGQTAVIEMASAAGFVCIPPERRRPLRATTRGVGQLIADAVKVGCQRIIIGLGDSATVDVGAGMIGELGAVFLDSRGEEVAPLPQNFSRISRIDMSGVMQGLTEIKFFGYADVLNPIIGPDGAVRVYGPQKGVTPEMMPLLEAGVERMVEIMESTFNISLHHEPMTGAAGGLGGGVMAFLNGSLMRGAPAIARLIRLEDHVKDSDLVITGEGRLDEQSLSGKVVAEVASLAVNNGKPCWAVTGEITDPELARSAGIEKVIEVSPGRVPSSAEEAYKLIKEATSQ